MLRADRALPWSEVSAVEAEGGKVVVRTRTGERWAAVEMQNVPNAFLLAELVAQRVGDHASQARLY